MPAHQGLSAVLLADSLLSLNDTSQKDDRTVQNCTLFTPGGVIALFSGRFLCGGLEFDRVGSHDPPDEPPVPNRIGSGWNSTIALSSGVPYIRHMISSK